MWKISIDAEIFRGSGFATSESIFPGVRKQLGVYRS